MPTTTRPLGPGVRRRGMLAVLLLGQAMASIDGSIVSVAVPSIRTGLHASDAEIQLVVSGYLLTTGVLFVTCARIGDVVGHRRAFLVGLAWFTAASLLCGVSITASMLVMARIAQAVGAALVMPQVFSVIHQHWKGASRRRAIGLYGMVLAGGVAVGQVCGGLIVGTDLLGLAWRPVFLMNIPLGIIVVVVGAHRLPDSPPRGRVRLDLVGVALLTVAMTALILPLIFGVDRGSPVSTCCLIALGMIVLGVFVRHERRARNPVLDLAVLRPKAIRLGMTSCCIVMGCYTVFLLTLTVHLQSALGHDPLAAGMVFVPYAIGFGLVSLSWNRCPQRVHRLLPVVGPVVCAAGLLLAVVLLRDHWLPVASCPLLLLAGAGHAAGYSPLIALITTDIDPRLASAVSALNSTGPVLSEVIAVAGLGSVYFAASSSAGGLLYVTIAVAALLCVAAGCAAGAIRDH